MEELRKGEEKFNIVKRGYEVTEVNQYIEKLEDVIHSYKEKDNTIKNAIINAQIAADGIVRNAELESEKIFAKTNAKIAELADDIARQKQRLKNFEEEYNLIMNKYLIRFNESEFLSLTKKLDDIHLSLNTSKDENIAISSTTV